MKKFREWISNYDWKIVLSTESADKKAEILQKLSWIKWKNLKMKMLFKNKIKEAKKNYYKKLINQLTEKRNINILIF